MRLEMIRRAARGDERAHPLLFVHGAWHGAWCWEEHFLDWFAERGWHVAAVDLRGHGGSPLDGSMRRVRIDDYVEDVAEAAARMAAPPVLVGHSMGGLVVQRHLEEHTAPGAILLAPVPVGGAWKATFRVVRRHPLAFLRAVGTLRMWPIVSDRDRARSLFFAPDLPDEAADRYLSRLQDESFLAYVEMLTIRMPRPARIDTPTLVLAAGADALFSVAQQEKTARGYGSSPVVIAGAGHDLMLDPAWETAAAAMAEWLDDLDQG